ncbi:MAG: hypothetical protein ACYDH0_08615 [Candidatus Aminicenantales bacterium]
MNEPQEPKKMKPIWYFVGLVLLSIGALVFSAGVVMAALGVKSPTVLSELHPDIWWGAIMLAAGGIFFWKNR